MNDDNLVKFSKTEMVEIILMDLKYGPKPYFIYSNNVSSLLEIAL